MDAAEAHGRMMTATGGQPYTPPLEVPAPMDPPTGQAVVPGHGALIEPERVEPTEIVTGSGLNGVATAMGAAATAMEGFAAAALKLVETAEEVADQDGREIWLTAGEVELDQWTQRLTDAAAVVRRQIGGRS